MKKLILFTAIMLSGCFSDTDDLKVHIANVQANTSSAIEPMPEVTVYGHFDYSAQSLRSPFDAPKPEAIQEKIQQMSGCLSPDPRRRKQPLEKFSLSDLVMRGTLGELGVTWALVEASDNTLHRVAVGSYVGLYNGRITSVSEDNVKVVELIPDGAGCWVERETVVAMTQTSAEGQRK
ncbi:type IV pilus assembly protein PilP [Colwellia chukchiensis]|uniref:Type IV pilus assembly protein PilP n=1 Tax=Colwellia chukchiensis TaxID=641665 RepID=A0A1H7PSF4_9GAMM|nr:pilus assembly protein PilP [Colwellia chukchiensis]SEL38693.1 type IV pilus assembly protein PilP [Colwellia chukchiensis]